MRLRDARSALRAFTLAESLVATMVIGIAFAALAVASVALQRSLYSARDYSNALNIQTRIADYIRRDSLEITPEFSSCAFPGSA